MIDNIIYFYDDLPRKWIILGMIHKNSLAFNKCLAKYKTTKEDPLYECIWRKIRTYKPGYDSWFGLIKKNDKRIARFELGLGSVNLFKKEVVLHLNFYKNNIVTTHLEKYDEDDD